MKNEPNNLNENIPPKIETGRKKGRSVGDGKRSIILFLVFIFFMAALAFLLNYLNNYGNRPIGLVPGGGGNGTGVIDDSANQAIKMFASTDELKNFLDEGMANSSYGMMSGAYGMAKRELTEEAISQDSNSFSNAGEIQKWGAMEKPSSDAGFNNPMSSDYSATNVQVVGVDEADIVKTDGEYIYAISGNAVSIVKSFPAESSEIISKIEFDAAPQGMYLDGNRLAVYGQKRDFGGDKALNDILMPAGRTNFTYFKIYDISDKRNPREERSLYFEGNNANSRMIGDYVYLVTSSYPSYGYSRQTEGNGIIAPLMIENSKILNNGEKDIACRGCPNIYYFNMPYNSYAYTTVSSINMKDTAEKVKSEVFLLDQTQNNIYVSENNLYITYTKQISEEALTRDITMGMIKEHIYPKLSENDRKMIEEIENTKNYILSPQEKYSKIISILEKYEKEFQGREDELERELENRIKQKYEDISKELEKTVIHKIAINNGDLKYRTAGDVTGMVLNQFSMDENGGYFRIATTKNRTWSRFGLDGRESYSNLYVLDSSMRIVGKVENIAKGEQIYSARFMQNRAYMVTFRRTDPLFVIDLSSPSDPKILGKLKVPGFSSYLHPYDETTLIGLGKESDENGRVTGGVKLSMFDVADVENPRELDKYVIGDSSSNSIAIDEHKAFLFSRDKNLLVIPVNMQENFGVLEDQRGISLQQEMIFPRPIPQPVPPAYPRYFNGAYVFSIDKYRFSLKGKIDHNEDAAAEESNVRSEGKVNKGLRFDGTGSDYIAIDGNDSLRPSLITIESWINMPSIPKKGSSVWIAGRFTTENNILSLLADGRVRFEKRFAPGYGGDDHASAFTDSPISAGWHHIVATYDKKAMKIYIDGVLKGETKETREPYYEGNGMLYIGANNGFPEKFLGSVDEVRIYGRAITAKEVKSRFSGKEISLNGLAGWWKFDEEAGSAIMDSSGNGNNGKLVNAKKHIYGGYGNDYNLQVKRSLYIKDVLYTLSGRYLKSNRMEDLSEVKKIELPGYSDNNFVPME